MSKVCGDLQPGISLEKAGENGVCVRLLVHIGVCLLTCLIKVPHFASAFSARAGSFFSPVTLLICTGATSQQ